MESIILLIIISAILFFAGYYIYRAKKRGEVCIGCPYAKNCASKGHCGEYNHQM